MNDDIIGTAPDGVVIASDEGGDPVGFLAATDRGTWKFFSAQRPAGAPPDDSDAPLPDSETPS